jgi:hypothetical protein
MAAFQSKAARTDLAHTSRNASQSSLTAASSLGKCPRVPPCSVIKTSSRCRVVPGVRRMALKAMRESCAEFVAPAPDFFITDDYASLEQQRFNVAQAQSKPEIPANRATDDGARKSMAMIQRRRCLHRITLPGRPVTVTRPFAVYMIGDPAGDHRAQNHAERPHAERGAELFERNR